ncbi:MAG: hypothetical protein H6721_24090 [Sandaracinus sp.]|nr:hypothetical protein [Sandaracinus sp.]MCB9635214.1 hypothetical protein [Sandaracinus sp.]
MRKHLIVLVLALGALTAVAVAQDPAPSEAEVRAALQASSGVAADVLANAPRPPSLPAGAWEITTRTIRSNCPQGADQETSYTGTLSRGPSHMTLAVPTSPNWKQFRGEVIGNQVMFTAYQDAAAVHARVSSSPQVGVFHMVLRDTSGNGLEGYGFRSTWLPPAGGRRGGLCDESLSVRLRKL